MTSAVYFGTCTDMKFLHVEDLKNIRHFILVDQLPCRVKYYPQYFNEFIFTASIYHNLCKEDVEIIDTFQRPDFIKFILVRKIDNIQITVDYYYNTTVEDVITISEVGDLILNVNTLILSGLDPFDPYIRSDPNEYVLMYEHIPNVKNVWITGDGSETGLYMPIDEFKQLVVDTNNDWYSHWYCTFYSSSSSDDESMYSENSDDNDSG